MKKASCFLLALTLIAALLSLPALAAETEYVYDLAELLTDAEIEVLTSAAESISQTYGVGVYIATLDDMEDYGFYDIESCAEAFFDGMELGLGEDRTGILLILSMADRDYDIDAHGEYGHFAFTDYGKTTISDAFLDNFRQNDWYGGFFDYLSQTEALLRQAETGNPVDVPPAPKLTPGGLICSAVLSVLAAWGVCSVLKGRNKTAKLAVDADTYVAPGGAQITRRDDRFSHITTSRRRIERSERSGGGGGGTTVSSGGHSHSSGKF